MDREDVDDLRLGTFNRHSILISPKTLSPRHPTLPMRQCYIYVEGITRSYCGNKPATGSLRPARAWGRDVGQIRR